MLATAPQGCGRAVLAHRFTRPCRKVTPPVGGVEGQAMVDADPRESGWYVKVPGWSRQIGMAARCRDGQHEPQSLSAAEQEFSVFRADTHIGLFEKKAQGEQIDAVGTNFECFADVMDQSVIAGEPCIENL